MQGLTFAEAVEKIEGWYREMSEEYKREVVPGVSDNSVLEAELDTLEGVLEILGRVGA
jgi:hypothetical protein